MFCIVYELYCKRTIILREKWIGKLFFFLFFFLKSATKGMFKSAFEFVETPDTSLSGKMTGLELDRAECEFILPFPHRVAISKTNPCLTGCED